MELNSLHGSVCVLEVVVAKTSVIDPPDPGGFSGVPVDTTVGLSAVVVALHDSTALPDPTAFTGRVYQSIRSMAGLAGVGIDAVVRDVAWNLNLKSTPAAIGRAGR